MSHTHEFHDIKTLMFEDVLVAEVFYCNERHCEATKTVQYEVDFDSFVLNGTPLDDAGTPSEADDAWGAVCDEFGTDMSIAREKWTSDGTEIETRSGGQLLIEHDGEHITAITAEFDGDEIEFDVDFYRELSIDE